MKTPSKRIPTSSPSPRVLAERDLAATTGGFEAGEAGAYLALAAEAYDAARGFVKGLVAGFTKK